MSEKDQPTLVTDNNEKVSRCQKFRVRLKQFVIKNFLPISLITAVVFGTLVPQPGVFFNHKATSYVCISIMFLYSGLFLRTSAMKDAIKAYKAYIWGLISILGVSCIIGGQLTKLLNFDRYPRSFYQQQHNLNNATGLVNTTGTDATIRGLGSFEFKIGLIVYTSMPCTLASGVIMV